MMCEDTAARPDIQLKTPEIKDRYGIKTGTVKMLIGRYFSGQLSLS